MPAKAGQVDEGVAMMDFGKITDALSGRGGAIAAAALGTAAVGGLAWALSMGPLTPVRDAAGPTGSMGSGPVAMAASARTDAAAGIGAAGASAGAGQEENGPAGTASADPEPPAPDGEGAAPDPQPSSQNAPKPDRETPGASAQGAPEPSHGTPAAPRPSPKPEQPKPADPKPSHTHSWSAVYRTEPVYGQQWVPKWEDVYKGRQERYRCTTCGATYYSLPEMNAHLDSTIDWDQMTGHAGYLDDSFDIWEKEDRGSYQTVQTGTTQVIDHYECACGATR